MPDDEAFRLNRWDWNISDAHHPKYVIFSYQGQVRFAAEIISLVNIPASESGKKEIRGHVLDSKHPVYAQYVNKKTPEWAQTGGGRGPRYHVMN